MDSPPRIGVRFARLTALTLEVRDRATVPIGYALELDLDTLLDTLSRLRTATESRVVAQAINRTARSSRVFLRRSVQEVVALKAKDVNQTVTVRRATRRDPRAVIAVSRRSVPLLRYGARATARGVTVKVKREGGRKLVRPGGRGAFISTMPSTGHRGVFVRKGEERLSIRELFGPSVAQVVDDESLHGRLAQHASETFTRELARSVDRAVGRVG